MKKRPWYIAENPHQGCAGEAAHYGVTKNARDDLRAKRNYKKFLKEIRSNNKNLTERTKND